MAMTCSLDLLIIMTSCEVSEIPELPVPPRIDLLSFGADVVGGKGTPVAYLQ